MNIQWYPGHMKKTRELISENLKLVDIVIEIVDARIPKSSKNPEIDNILSNKKRIILINKSDIADKDANNRWVEYFKRNNIPTMLIDCVNNIGINKILSFVKEVLREKIESDQKKGMTKSIKMMIVGVPNVGKSTVINRLVGKTSAKTGNRPGVTKSKQWVRLGNGFELLDTPGILWPKFDDPEVGKKLAYTGAVRDEILDVEELCYFLIEYLKENYSNLLKERYKIQFDSDLPADEIIELIAKKRGAIMAGGVVDTFRISNIILDEFRSAKIGKITLEQPKM